MNGIELENKQLLEKILAVLKIAFNAQISEEKEQILKNETKRQVYDLCDGKHTVSEIAMELGTSQPNVSQHLSSLLESGLVLYDEVGGRRFYFKSLE